LNKIVFALCFFFLTSVLVAQRSFHFIADAGITASQISGDGFYGFGQFGGNFYGGIETSKNGTWGGAMLLGVNQKGARKYQAANDITTYRLRVNYVEAPLLVIYRYEKWHFASGPGFNFLLNHRERSMFGDIQPKRPFKQFELAFNAAISYEVAEQVSLRLWFQNSVLPARDHVSGQVYPPNNFILGDWHNTLLDKGQYLTSLMLTLGIHF
jgi:hypothetical protein